MVIEMYLCLLWEQLVWQFKFFLGMQLFTAASQTQESALAVTIQGGSYNSLPANLWLTDVTTILKMYNALLNCGLQTCDYLQQNYWFVYQYDYVKSETPTISLGGDQEVHCMNWARMLLIDVLLFSVETVPYFTRQRIMSVPHYIYI